MSKLLEEFNIKHFREIFLRETEKICKKPQFPFSTTEPTAYYNLVQPESVGEEVVHIYYCGFS